MPEFTFPTIDPPPDPLLIDYQGLRIKLAPDTPPKERVLLRRVIELGDMCMAWNVDWPSSGTGKWSVQRDKTPLPFKMAGPSGMGKSAIVEYLARKVDGYKFYSITGHEQLEPEELVLAMVPRADGEKGFALHASPLLTAVLTPRSIFFFDRIDRVPERTLSVLAPLLDHRRALFSRVVNRWFEPRGQWPGDFLFCAAQDSDSGGAMPSYIDQRLLPTIRVERPNAEEMIRLVRGVAQPDRALLDRFITWYMDLGADPHVSVRQCLALLEMAKRHDPDVDLAKLAGMFTSSRENWLS